MDLQPNLNSRNNLLTGGGGREKFCKPHQPNLNSRNNLLTGGKVFQANPT